MKQLKLTWLWLLSALIITGGVFVGCQKDVSGSDINEVSVKPGAHKYEVSAACQQFPQDYQCTGEGPYNISLESKSVPTTIDNVIYYAWTWKVAKPEGVQDISHWNLILPPCLTIDDVLKIEFSYDGVTFTDAGTPTYQSDPSLNGCTALEQYCVLKFDEGHVEGNPNIWYRITINTILAEGVAYSIYKSGVNTGCGVQCYTGIGCEVPTGCTYTQGFWKTHGPDVCRKGQNDNEWPSGFTGLTIRGNFYDVVALCTLLNTPVNGTNLMLTHQLIAAELNKAKNGGVPSDVQACINNAYNFLNANGGVAGTVSTNSLKNLRGQLTTCLANYNEGPNHCD